MAISSKKTSIRVTLPTELVNFLEQLAQEGETTKSSIIETLLNTFIASTIKSIEKQNNTC